MSFFYDLNKKLDSIRATPEVTHQQLNERDMKKTGKLEEEGFPAYAKGIMKYGKDGMDALRDAEAEGESLGPVRKKHNKYDNKEVKEESGEWSSIPVGVIDGPGGYDGAQQRIKDYESGNINRDGKKSPPVVDRSRPADKPTVYDYRGQPEEYSSPPEWKGGYRPPVVDRSRPAFNEGPVSTGKKIYNVGKQAADEISDYFSRNPKTGELNTLPDRDMRPGETFDTAWERMQDTRAMQQGRGEIKRGKYGGMHVDPKTGAYVPQPPVYIKADEGLAGAGKKIYDLGKRAASGINKMIGHGSDEELLGTLRKDVGVIHPTGGKRPTPPEMQSTGKRPPRDPDGEDNEIIRPDDPRAKQANAYFDKQVKEAGAPMTPKQKSFAKLAPPANKITFADKIAGAKKEVDEMLGDVAAEAMRSALGGGKGRNAEMDEERSKGTAFDLSTRRVDTPKAGSTERGAKHDIKHSTSDPRYTGRTVTRRTDAQGISVGADDDSDTQAGPRGRGRPKGTKGAIGAKGPSGKSKLMTKEGEDDPAEKGEYDREGDMALDDIDTIESAANELQSIIDAEDNLPEWVQSKINKAMDYLDTARDYMAAQGNDQEPIAEKAVSKQQQKFMGMAHAMQKGEKIKGASKELKTVARTMKPKDTKDFAKTKHKGLPDKVKKKEVDENSEEGRLVTKRTGPGQSLTTSTTGRVSATLDKGKVSVKPGKSTDDDADTASAKDTSASKSNSMVGKGIYDSMNRELELMIAESMSINMSDSTEGGKSLTITATDEDALKLGMLLKNAGLGGHGGDMHSHGEEACDTCGMQDCGCGDVQEAVDENSPDWPTNTETSSDALQYAGGLNKPKTDVAGNGQSTVPVVATRPHNDDDLQRIREMAGIKIKNNLGPISPAVARMSKDEVDAELRSMLSPDNAAMSSDEVNAAFRSGMSPDISDMNPDSANAEFGKDSIQRMKEMAGIREAEKTEEGNLFTAGLEDDDVKIGDTIPGTNAIKKKDIDESIFALTNQWRAYKG